MSLFPDREVFADNPEFETSKGQINYDATRVFQGTLEGRRNLDWILFFFLEQNTTNLFP